MELGVFQIAHNIYIYIVQHGDMTVICLVNGFLNEMH